VSPEQPPRNRQARLRSIVDQHLKFVARTLRNAGVPESELDDEVQRTFITAARRLDEVRVGAERRFLFQVAVNMAWHTRRKLARRREVLSDTLPERVESLATPEHLTNRKQMQELLEHIASSMHKSIRAVFMLHEFEGMNLKEIAQFLGAPPGTVASRLRRAREHFRSHVTAVQLAGDVGAPVPSRIVTRASFRRGTVSALEHALRGAGRSVPAMSSTRARTLAALGFGAARTGAA
jgi:RNA polymerase sigma-70 factor (ECF subfamily)